MASTSRLGRRSEGARSPSVMAECGPARAGRQQQRPADDASATAMLSCKLPKRDGSLEPNARLLGCGLAIACNSSAHLLRKHRDVKTKQCHLQILASETDDRQNKPAHCCRCSCGMLLNMRDAVQCTASRMRACLPPCAARAFSKPDSSQLECSATEGSSSRYRE